MTISIMSLLLNLLIVGLLMSTISYCWILNKRIKILQDGKSELANLLQYFDESTARASETIMALQSASKKIGENIQNRIDKANYLMDDLAFMVEKGNRLADQLEANFAVNRARNRTLSENNVEGVTENKNDEILKPIPAVEQPIIMPKIVEKMSSKEKTAASLEAVLDRVIGRSKPNNTNANNINSGAKINERDNSTRSNGKNITRSKAEQELLDMIRAGIRG